MSLRKILILSAIFLFLIIPFAGADGAAFLTGNDFSINALHGEHTQIAAINYENGKEKLVIAVKMEQIKNNDVVWIVPVPSEPEDVKINILENFPSFRGEDMIKKAEIEKETLEHLAPVMSAGQLWTIPYYMFFFPYPLFYISGLSAGANYGAEVYAEVEKEGILTQVVTAETSQGLYNYLTDKGVRVSEVSIPVLDDYIGKGYSFVVSWLTGKEKETNKKYDVPAIFVEFPTDRIFYPLKPTSLYGERGVPVIIYVVGFVEPEFYDEIKEFARYKHFYQGRVSHDWPSEFYGTGKANNGFYYTRINIGFEREMAIFGYDPDIFVETPPAKNFVDDLWLEKLEKTPPEIEKAVFTMNSVRFLSSPVGFAVLLLLTSFLTGIIAGLIVFRDSRILGFGLLGLANLFTIMGLIIATNKLMKGESKSKRTAFVVLFSVIFVFVVNTVLVWGLYSILYC